MVLDPTGPEFESHKEHLDLGKKCTYHEMCTDRVPLDGKVFMLPLLTPQDFGRNV